MDSTMEELQAMLDRDKIRDCIVRIARGEDRRNPDLIKSGYWPDAETDFGMFKGDFEAYFNWVYPGADVITNTQHVLAQSLIVLDGDTARVETHVMSYHRVDYGESEHDAVMGGRYLDVMARRGGEWRIASRTMLYDWCQDWGTSADWSQGVMGVPLSAEHFTGRAKGDYSAVFFGEARA